MKDEDIHPLVPDDTGAKWNARARGTRGVMQRAKKGFFKSFAGSLDGAMGLARKYYIKLKKVADEEARQIEMMSEEEEENDVKPRVEVGRDSHAALVDATAPVAVAVVPAVVAVAPVAIKDIPVEGCRFLTS